MDAIDRAMAIFRTGVGEIADNAHVRHAFQTLFVADAQQLYAHGTMQQETRRKLDAALRLKSADPVTTYRGLFLQLHGAFELYIKQLVSAVLQHKSSAVDRYNDLDEAFRNAHAVHAAVVLAKIPEGGINGISYDFEKLKGGMAACFSNKDKFELNPEVFTLLLGNCTPKRLEKLFATIGMAHPFDDETGRNAAVKKWALGASPREAKKKALENLDQQLKRRNAIAHGDGTQTIVHADIDDLSAYLLAIAEAFEAKARAAL